MPRDKKTLKICPLHKCLLQEGDRYCPWHGVELETLVGQTINGFVVEEPLSGGGYAVVYRATAIANPQFVVAMKILRPPYCYQQVRVEDFLNEAVATQGIPPPNIPPIFGVMGTPWPHLTMELVRGSTLEALLARSENLKKAVDEPAAPASSPALSRLLPLGESIDYLIGIARPIAGAHRLGRVHRDLKPSNIMISQDEKAARPEDRVKVIDWGIALVLANTQSIAVDPRGTQVDRKTARYQIAGTLPYMAPEAFDGSYSPQTDIYAFGVTAFELLTGQRPHDPPLTTSPELDTVSAWKQIHQGTEPKRISAYRRVPKRLRRLVRNCLQKAPEERPSDGRMLLEELLAIRKARDWRAFARNALGIAAAALIVLLTTLLVRDTFFAKLPPESLRAFASAMNLGYVQGSSFYASEIKEARKPTVDLPPDFKSLEFGVLSDDSSASEDPRSRSAADLPGYLADEWYRRCKEREPGDTPSPALTCRVVLKGRARGFIPKRIHHELSFVYDLRPPTTAIGINSRAVSPAGPHYFLLNPTLNNPLLLGFELRVDAEDNVPLPLSEIALLDTNDTAVSIQPPRDSLQDPGLTFRRNHTWRITLPATVVPPLRLRMTNLAGLSWEGPSLYPVPSRDQVSVVGEPGFMESAVQLSVQVPGQYAALDGWTLLYEYTQGAKPQRASRKLDLKRANGWTGSAALPGPGDTHMWLYLALADSTLESQFLDTPIALPKAYAVKPAEDFIFALDTSNGKRSFVQDSGKALVRTNARPEAITIELKNDVAKQLRSLKIDEESLDSVTASSRRVTIARDFSSTSSFSKRYRLTYETHRGGSGEIGLSVALDPDQPDAGPFTMNGASPTKAGRFFVKPAGIYKLEGSWPEDATKLTVTAPRFHAGGVALTPDQPMWSLAWNAADLRAALSPCDGACEPPCCYVGFSLTLNDRFGNEKTRPFSCGIFGRVETLLFDSQGRSIRDNATVEMPGASLSFSICNPVGFEAPPVPTVHPSTPETRKIEVFPLAEPFKYEVRYRDEHRYARQATITIEGTLGNGDKVSRSVSVRPPPPESVPDFRGLSWRRIGPCDEGEAECVYVSTTEVSWGALAEILARHGQELPPEINKVWEERVRAQKELNQLDSPVSGMSPETALLVAQAAGCDLLSADQVIGILEEQARRSRQDVGFCDALLAKERVNSAAARAAKAGASDAGYFHGMVDFVGNLVELVKPGEGAPMVYGAPFDACVRCDSPDDARCAFVVRTAALNLDAFAPRHWKGSYDKVSFRLLIHAGKGVCPEFDELVNRVRI